MNSARHETALFLREQGRTLAEIGERLGVSRQRVHAMLKRVEVDEERVEEAQAERAREARTFTCQGCGEAFEARSPYQARKQKFHSRECCAEYQRRLARTHLGRWWRPFWSRGGWWIRDPDTQAPTRYARFLAERYILERPMKPNEWAVLVDGNAENVTLENIRVCSPAEAHRIRKTRELRCAA